jgi:hypothetical protein
MTQTAVDSSTYGIIINATRISSSALGNADAHSRERDRACREENDEAASIHALGRYAEIRRYEVACAVEQSARVRGAALRARRHMPDAIRTACRAR